METKINVAKILKNKPEGTKLWTDMFGSVTLYVVTDVCDAFQVKHHNKEPWFDEDGKLYKEGVLCIYPSKSMRDWEKFAWKKGDVLVNSAGFNVFFDRWANDNYTRFFAKTKDLGPSFSYDTYDYTLISKEDASKFVKSIEYLHGGILNLDTLEIEKQPEFKDGDIVCISGMGYLAYSIVKSIDNSSKKLEYYVLNDMSTLKFEDWLSFEDKQIQPISETQQIILFEALAKKGKVWDSEKKAIVGLKPKFDELKPFDKVLVRDSESDKWRANLFAYISEDGYYCCVYAFWVYCIPYAGNEHLLGTTKDVEG